MPIKLAGGDTTVSGPLRPDSALPLLVQPSVTDLDLAEWSAGNRDWIEGRLSSAGALLFRGFGVRAAAEFEAGLGRAVLRAVRAQRRAHAGQRPRTDSRVLSRPPVSCCGTTRTRSNRRWPRKIIFCCSDAPSSGGETPLADSREVYRRLDSRLRDRFESKGIRYQRNYGGGVGLSWQQVFQTTDPVPSPRPGAGRET